MCHQSALLLTLDGQMSFPQACQHELGNHHSVPSPHQLTHARRRQMKQAGKALPDNVCCGTFHQVMLLVPDAPLSQNLRLFIFENLPVSTGSECNPKRSL